jgi:hypothetical protein
MHAAGQRHADEIAAPVDRAGIAMGHSKDERIGRPVAMSRALPREFTIHGVTREGKPFRPSDWAERLAGALSSFRPTASGIGAHIGYSPYCVPRVVDGAKCVIVSEALRAIEPMAWDFVMSFARDNELRLHERIKVTAAA